MKTQEIKDMAKALATMRESAKTRALASVKAQPKDKVSLAPAPWDKKKAAKDESLDYNPSKGEYNQKPGKEVGKKVGTREDASNDKSDDGEGLDKVDTKATKKKFANRKDKDIDNDGDTDSSDEYLHKRRKAISKSVDEAVLLGRDYEVKDGNIHITKAKLMKVPSRKKYSDGSYSMMHGGKLVGITIVKESEVQEAGPKMKGDSVAIQRAKDKAHADAMGRHVKSGRAKSVKEASLDEASKEGTIKIIKTKDNMFQVQRMTKGKFVDQGKPHKSAKDAEKVRSTGQDTMQFEELEELTAAENKLIAQLYDSKGNLNALGKKVLAVGKNQKNEAASQVDELSKKTLGSYVKKAADDMADNAYTLGARDPKKKAGSWSKSFKRGKGIAKATDKLANESVEVEEAKTDVYHKLMLKALGKTKLPKGHGNTSSVANNGDFVVADGGGRVIGRLKKGEFVLPSKNESVEVAEVTIAKGTHTPNNGSPRGEGLSPNAKDQLKTANDTVDDEVDGPVVNKKSFDAMRASLKTAPKRNADNDTGDKVIVKGGK